VAAVRSHHGKAKQGLALPAYGATVHCTRITDGFWFLLRSTRRSGTPNTAGSSNFTITATDSAKAMASRAYTIVINSSGSPLSITSASPLPGGAVGVAYSQTLAAIGGTTPYTWSITTGALPDGLTLNSSTGVISGTPIVAAALMPAF